MPPCRSDGSERKDERGLGSEPGGEWQLRQGPLSLDIQGSFKNYIFRVFSAWAPRSRADLKEPRRNMALAFPRDLEAHLSHLD